ncbi:DNA gyrase, A subunit [[Eubacterium] siraeum DSM 15702]|uniref:DNA gyrase subunit A n=1 Tax=[Eubacterium] siraeum DSM 15702 TaxID=428128 RepID=B0MRF5_9FIRM|nr:DNA gyrase, A subunit [[Eubacterium] siraeum DSM 15702]UWP25265.1 DNA gyrase subunit A [[Eubacterium] siraeum]
MEKDVKEFSTATEKLIQVDIEKEMRESFLQYSMAVLVSRALPDVRDGMKPVHRRIIYTMNEADNTSSKPYRKCAYTVGEVLGKYHPHGDASVYDALVRLAQDFSMRYPLIDGHGNFGSVDGDPPAAYRYTEARMAKIASELLKDIKKDTIDWGKNYDDKLDEPTVLPVKFPNLLVNGSVGIAVGMATNIPPHNLNEVCDAIVARMDNPECSIEEILQYIKGPDFPTGGIIMGYSGIRSAYYTGRGKITLRGKAEIVEEGNHSRIIVTEIPYMVNKSKLLETTGQLMRDKRIEGISNLRDESDKDGMRIVYELKRDVNAQVVLNKLYSFTQLQDTVGVIMIALVNGEPKQLTLLEILDNYIAFQKQIITRRTAFDLKKARERAHILQGFLLAIDNIDEVISILRSSKSVQEGKERLMERFKEDDLAKLLQRAMGENYKDVHFEHEIGLSEEQADAIVQMRLGQLTGLERDKVISELAEIMEKINDFLDILSSDERVKEIIKEEITAIKEKYGDERRTAIEPVSGEVDIEDLIPEEECVLTYTNIGYIKRQPVDVYNLQKRGGKGVSGMKQREEDFVEDMFISSTHDNILFITNYGNMYKLKCYEVPEGSKQSRGTNIVNLLQLDEGERIAAMMKTSDFAENKYFICVTKYGKIKRTPLYDFRNVRKNGLRAITLAEGDEIAAAHLTEGDSSIIVATHLGMAIHFSEDKIRSMGRLAAGVRAIKLREDDYIVGAAKVYSDDMRILTVTDKGYGRLSALSDYRMQNRGGNGLKNYKIRDDRGYVCGIRSIQADDDVILISTDGVIIRIRANDLRVMRRTGLGVRVMKLSDEDRVVTFTRTEHDETADIEEVEQASDEEIAAAEAEAEAEVIEDEPETNEEE